VVPVPSILHPKASNALSDAAGAAPDDALAVSHPAGAPREAVSRPFGGSTAGTGSGEIDRIQHLPAAVDEASP
jgi:hypothetical protein